MARVGGIITFFCHLAKLRQDAKVVSQVSGCGKNMSRLSSIIIITITITIIIIIIIIIIIYTLFHLFV